MNTVTMSRGLSRRICFTYCTTGRVISRYGEATTVSGTGMSLRSHSSCSRAVSASSTFTVIASRWLGRVARA